MVPVDEESAERIPPISEVPELPPEPSKIVITDPAVEGVAPVNVTVEPEIEEIVPTLA